MFNRKFLLGAFLLAGGASVVLGCEIDLPTQLLNDRAGSLKAAPANSFAYEIQRLIAPPAAGPAAKPVATQPATDAQLALEQQIRTASINGNVAFAAATEANLPIAERYYTAAQVDFAKQQWSPAAKRLQALLALPADQRSARAIDAAFSLGRISATTQDLEWADQYFALTRTLAAQGLPDDGLALASYGDQARAHYHQAKSLLSGNALPDGDAPYFAREITKAIDLYAQQASQDNGGGLASLRIVAEKLLADPSTTSAALSSPHAQALLVGFLEAGYADDIADPDDETTPGKFDPTAVLQIMANAAQAHPTGWLADSDRLAALAYRDGKYDLAKSLANASSGPLAAWVQAKLALQQGDLASAAKFYATAAKSFPTNASALDPDNRQLLIGETGVLSLARGEYVEALDHFCAAGPTYWGDTAHVADRVLTTAELKSFVDAKIPAGRPTECGAEVAGRLRDLLARRLVREGHYAEATPYFQDPATAKLTNDYASALHQAHWSWNPITRAQGWFHAASLLHQSGMEMMGSEGEPDEFYWQGEYADPGEHDYGAPLLGQDTLNPKDAFVTPGEIQRFNASAITPDLRYHYRYLAADEANRAADFLPSRSQAFAAVLCNATSWMLSSNSDRAQTIYQRYLKQGALLRDTKYFGRACPAPNFGATYGTIRHQFARGVRHFISSNRWLLLALAILIAALTSLQFARRRKPNPN